LKLAQALSKELPKIDPAKLMPLTAALANGRISVLLATRTGGAECKGMQTSTNVIGLLLGQLTSAVAAEYAILLVHTFTPYDCDTRLSETMNSAGNASPGFENSGAGKAPPCFNKSTFSNEARTRRSGHLRPY
jgi:hypothetical protein